MTIVYRPIADSATFQWNNSSAKKVLLEYILGNYLVDNELFSIIDDSINLSGNEGMLEMNKENSNFNANKYSKILSGAWKEVQEMQISEINQKFEDKLRTSKDNRKNPFSDVLSRNRDIKVIDILDETKRERVLGAKGSAREPLYALEDGWDEGTDTGDNFDNYYGKIVKVRTGLNIGAGKTLNEIIFEDIAKDKIERITEIGFTGIKQITKKKNLKGSSRGIPQMTWTEEETPVQTAGSSGGKLSTVSDKGEMQLGPRDDSNEKKIVSEISLKERTKIKLIKQALNTLSLLLDNLTVTQQTLDTTASEKPTDIQTLDTKFDVQAEKPLKVLSSNGYKMESMDELKEVSDEINSYNSTINNLYDFLRASGKNADKIYKELFDQMKAFELTPEKYNLLETKKLLDGKKASSKKDDLREKFYKTVKKAIDTSLEAKKELYSRYLSEVYEEIKEKLKLVKKEEKKLKADAKKKAERAERERVSGDRTKVKFKFGRSVPFKEKYNKEQLKKMFDNIETEGKKFFTPYINDIDGIYEGSIQITREEKPIFSKTELKLWENVFKAKKQWEDKDDKGKWQIISGILNIADPTEEIEDWPKDEDGNELDSLEKIKEAKKYTYKLAKPINILLKSTLAVNMGKAAMDQSYQSKVNVGEKGKPMSSTETSNISKVFAWMAKRIKRLKSIIGD